MNRTFVALCAGAFLLLNLSRCGVEQCPAGTYELDGKCLAVTTSSVDGVQPSAGAASGASGEICKTDADCSGEPTCDEPDVCQGTRPKAVCRDNVCKSTTFAEDDFACGEDVVADDCGLFKPIFCDGSIEQDSPECPDACSVDDECDAKAKCIEGDCVALGSLDDGEACTTGAECRGKHCANGFCCKGGDCCSRASQCPADYSSEPTCDEPSKCEEPGGMHSALLTDVEAESLTTTVPATSQSWLADAARWYEM
jgi:hypothetical protein